MSDKILVYGANGYTGKLIARHAKETGTNIILAGRSADKVKEVADPLGFEVRAFGLDDQATIVENIKDVAVVLHVAGPFSATSAPMVDACIAAGVHYLDITGEIDVFEACAAKSDQAKAKDVMVLPGVGFDVVPSDCIAAFVAQNMPEADQLKIFISGLGSASQGTMKTAIESLGADTRARRNNKIVEVKGGLNDQRDFGDGIKDCVGISWGDVSTAWHSTKVPNIEVYFEAAGPMKMMGKMGPVTKAILKTGFVKNMLKKRIEKGPAGPSDEERAAGYSILIGEAYDKEGNSFRARLRTPEGYTLTFLSGLEIAKRAAAGDFKAGYQTPSSAYGADFILDFEGVSREVLNS